MAEDPDAPKRTVFITREDLGTVPPNPQPQVPPSPPGMVGLPDVAPIEPSAFVPAPPPAAAPSPPPRFGEAGSLVGATLNDNYEVTRYITQGGMGEIYEGRQIRGNVKVAIKVILPQFAADPEFYNLLEREADLLATLGHDAIVKFRGLSQDRASGVDYLTLEYVQGPSLEDAMDDGPVDARLARALLRRLASGLDAAHEKGVYHRDLSPDNILLRDGKFERATIIDFGIAKDADTSKKTVIGAGFGGKLGFAAPEAFGMFGREIGAWTDVYSLALVVAAAARGQVIDMGTATPIDAIQARQSVPTLDGVEPWLAGVLAHMLAPDPASRLRTMSDVIAALDALPPVGTPFEAAPPPPSVEAAFGLAGAAAAPTAPSPFGSLDAVVDEDSGTELRLIRADTATGEAPARSGSRMPLYIGGGVLVAAIIGGVLAFSGGDSPKPAGDIPEITATEVQNTSPNTGGNPATTPPIAPKDWSAARTAIAAIPCSDIRTTEPGAGAGTLALTGWMPAGTTLPATAGGYRLDSAALRPISPAPSPETCTIIAGLKTAAGNAATLGPVQLSPETTLSFSDLKKTGGAYQVPNGLADVAKSLFLINIEDNPVNPAQRVASGLVPAGTLAFPSDSNRPVRYLQFFIDGPKPAAIKTDNGSPAAIASACNGNCTSTSGWVILR